MQISDAVFNWTSFYKRIAESRLDKMEERKESKVEILSWKDLPYWESDDWKKMQDDLAKEHDYLPNSKNIFKALWITPLDSVKAIILGQDPYFTPALATGLAFSIKPFVRVFPPSLINIFKEYKADLGYPYLTSGDLIPWAEQGVLLLNTVLTVKPGQPMSHHHLGWQKLTSQIIKAVYDFNPDTVFILWGREAKKIVDGICQPKHIVASAHPSPRSADKGFFGSRPFTRTNALLASNKKPTINWKLV